MKKQTNKAVVGAQGKKDLFLFDPEDLVIVEDKKSALYDERHDLELKEPFILNVMHFGVLEPVLVRKNLESGKTEVIAGRQRVRAAREANKRLTKKGLEPIRVPAIIKRGDAGQHMGMMVSENEQRQDDTPLGRARKMHRFIELGRTEEEAGVVFGCSAASVKNVLSLLDAPKELQKAVESGTLGVSDAYKLAKLEPAEAKKRLAELAEKAPREKGKKRTNAKKAREIVDGTAGTRGKKELAAKLAEVQASERMKADQNMGAEAALRWALGDGTMLEEIMS